MSLLITPTLFDSLEWYYNCPPSWKEKAYKDLSNKLNRIWTSNPAVEMGMKFEKQVYSHVNDPSKGTEHFQKVCKLVQGGNFQSKAKKIIVIDGKEFCWYGKLDVNFPKKKIIDIKTTGSWKGAAKYLKGWQHKFYCHMTDTKDFQYLVVEWTDDSCPETGYKIKTVHDDIHYHIEDPKSLEKEISDKTIEWMDFLDMHDELKDAYHNKFNMF